MAPRTITILMLISIASGTITAVHRSNGRAIRARVLETGEFHGAEVEATTGEKWLGLHISDNHQSLLLTYQLTVEPVQDLVVDDLDQMTGKKVSVDLPLQPIFLVDAKSLSAGPVQTVFEGDQEKPLDRMSPMKLQVADVSYELRITGSEEAEKCWNEGLPRNAQLVLASGESTQVLYSLDECGNDPQWFLRWAGDLDRDGKLDLYLSVTQHYNVVEKKLFLSSAARKGRLVKEVAEFVISGC